MEQEYIVETLSGSLYHVTYSKNFFKHGGRFNCRQLVGKTVDLSKDDRKIVAFMDKGGRFDVENLDLNHFRPGVRIIMEDRSQTSPIVKICQKQPRTKVRGVFLSTPKIPIDYSTLKQ